MQIAGEVFQKKNNRKKTGKEGGREHTIIPTQSNTRKQEEGRREVGKKTEKVRRGLPTANLLLRTAYQRRS